MIDSDKLSTVNPFSNYTISSNLKYGISDKILLNTNASYYNQEQVHTAEHLNYLLKGKSNIEEWSLGS